MQHSTHRGPESGTILIIVLFCLTLLLTIGVLMILNSGTESLLNSNYRTSTQAFYAAMSGLEEARGRLSPRHPDSISGVVAAAGTPLPAGQVFYIRNPLPGQAINPTDLAGNNPYADKEYGQEFGQPITSANVQFINSDSPIAGLNGPLYQWVRINPITEQSLNMDVDGDNNPPDAGTPLFYGLTAASTAPSLNVTSNGRQAFELTALAVLPNGSKRLLQYVITPAPLGYSIPSLGAAFLPFPSPLTLVGPVGTFQASNDANLWMNGSDQQSGGNCSPVESLKPAIGVDGNGNIPPVRNGIPRRPTDLQTNYIGSGGTPSVLNVNQSMPSIYTSVSGLDGTNGLVQAITQDADYVVQGPASNLPNYGSAQNPVATVVQGDLTLTSSVTGYGILLVTGTLTVSGDVGWKGIILVIGQGKMTVTSIGSGEYDGAILIANTRDPYNGILYSLGSTTVDWSAGGNNGVFYNSCWVQAAQFLSSSYRVLSFRQIPQ